MASHTRASTTRPIPKMASSLSSKLPSPLSCHQVIYHHTTAAGPQYIAVRQDECRLGGGTLRQEQITSTAHTFFEGLNTMKVPIPTVSLKKKYAAPHPPPIPSGSHQESQLQAARRRGHAGARGCAHTKTEMICLRDGVLDLSRTTSPIMTGIVLHDFKSTF
eukprot:SAG11_NODE_507_length_8879_cov_8.961048_10_plen_162_part_00